MGKVRTLNTKYGISKHRFKELYYWCLQYNEWKDELKYKTDTVRLLKRMTCQWGAGNEEPNRRTCNEEGKVRGELPSY